MARSNISVWQISGGPADRPFGDLFVKYGVGLIGPGDQGPWVPGIDDERFGGSFVRRFAAELQQDDVLLLRKGQSEILAIGLVASDYHHLEQFDDVNGWDLQHCRRVRWLSLPEPYQFNNAVFGANPSRLATVQNPKVVEYAQSFLASGLTQWQEAPLPDLPPLDAPLIEVPEYLHDVVGLAQDLSGLYWEEHQLGDAPNENEMVAHFTVPFLRSLGWPPEKIAIEWRRIDVALFDTLPRTPESCRFVIEAKRLGTGLEGARKQAEDYVAQLGVLRDVVVTDGFRYRVFACEENFELVAYANLARLKQSSTALFDKLRCT